MYFFDYLGNKDFNMSISSLALLFIFERDFSSRGDMPNTFRLNRVLKVSSLIVAKRNFGSVYLAGDS